MTVARLSGNALAAIASGWLTLREPGVEPESLVPQRVTAPFFEVLRARPAIGRVFTAENEAPGRDRVAVLSDALWRRRFGGDPQVVGRTIPLDDVEGGEGRYEVLGVMPPGFAYPVGASRPTDIWIPYVVPADQRIRNPASRSTYLQVIARLKPSVLLAAEQAQLEIQKRAELLQAREQLEAGLKRANEQLEAEVARHKTNAADIAADLQRRTAAAQLQLETERAATHKASDEVAAELAREREALDRLERAHSELQSELDAERASGDGVRGAIERADARVAMLERELPGAAAEAFTLAFRTVEAVGGGAIAVLAVASALLLRRR